MTYGLMAVGLPAMYVGLRDRPMIRRPSSRSVRARAAWNVRAGSEGCLPYISRC